MNFDKFQQQLAQKVTRHLGEKKNVLEVILTGQFITEKSKCLAINDGSKHLYIYTKQGSLRALKNSDGKEDYDALRSMNLNILSFEEYPWQDLRNTFKTTMNRDDLFDNFANIYCQQRTNEYLKKASCYLNEQGSVSVSNSDLPIPENRIISYVKELTRIFYIKSNESINFKIKLSQGDSKVVSLSKSDNKFLIESSTISTQTS